MKIDPGIGPGLRRRNGEFVVLRKGWQAQKQRAEDNQERTGIELHDGKPLAAEPGSAFIGG
jgi:hypothetical protein